MCCEISFNLTKNHAEGLLQRRGLLFNSVPKSFCATPSPCHYLLFIAHRAVSTAIYQRPRRTLDTRRPAALFTPSSPVSKLIFGKKIPLACTVRASG